MAVSRALELDLTSFTETNGVVTVFEEGTVPFQVRRAFLVAAKSGEVRGSHAHRRCLQLLVAVSGNITVITTDGRTETNYRLTSPTRGLLVPEMVWSTQIFSGPDPKMLVICDQMYDETDYIRNFAEFTSLIDLSSS